jgi:2-C-methyl-D-erythritol 4-phosphate cytidylyltransferase
VIVAAGSGERLGAGGPKALVRLGGRPLFEFSLDACLTSERVGRIVVAVPPGEGERFKAAAKRAAAKRAAAEGAAAGDNPVELVDGGATRSRSVAAGLARTDSDIVLVHDAARPFLTPDLINDCVTALEADPAADAAIAAARVTDTVKRVGDDGVVEETLDRNSLRAVQTPQVFRRGALERALREALASGDVDNATDDASLIESAGGKVIVVDSPSTNIKITVPADLELAEILMSQKC